MVVWAFDADVFHLAPFVWIRGAAGAELVLEQRFDLLQAPGFGLWQAAVNEDETQQGHAGVEEESTWKQENAPVTEDFRRPTRLLGVFTAIYRQTYFYSFINSSRSKHGRAWG